MESKSPQMALGAKFLLNGSASSSEIPMIEGKSSYRRFVPPSAQILNEAVETCIY